MNRFHPSMLILVVGLCVSFGSAASVTIENYSFENATGSGAQATAPSDWESTYTLDNQSQYPTDEMTIYARVDSGSLTNKDGNNYLRLYVDTYPGTSTYGAIVGSATEILCSTSLGTYQANTVYTLTVAGRRRPVADQPAGRHQSAGRRRGGGSGELDVRGVGHRRGLIHVRGCAGGPGHLR